MLTRFRICVVLIALMHVALNGFAIAQDGLVAHWPLVEDARDRGSHRLETSNHSVTFSESDRAAQFDGTRAWLEVAKHPALRFGQRDFTVCLWLHTAEKLDDVPGDLLSQYDAAKRRGWNLSLKSHSVTASQANTRTLHFGIDDNRIEPMWTDHGQVGGAMFVKALAVYEGALFAGTCEPGKDQSGRVYRFDGGQRWIDCGSPAACNAVSAFAVFDGKLFAGVSKYRLGGSALPESENPNLGGQVFRYEGGTRWTDCGQLPETEGIGGLAVFRGKLHAGSLYRPAGFFRYEGEQNWTRLPNPNGKRVEALCVHNGELFASSYDEAHIYRYNGEAWTDCGQVGDATNTQTYSFAIYRGQMYVGTWRSGKVFRYDGDNLWTDCGRLGEELEVMGMLVHNGGLFAGSLPLADVFRFRADPQPIWDSVGRVDLTPNVMYRRAWTMAEYQGRLFVGTLPSGRVLSIAAGTNVTHDRSLAAGWHHVAAQKSSAVLKLFINGRPVANSAKFDPSQFDISTDAPLRIGFGPTDYFAGRLRDVRIYDRALTLQQVEQLAR